MLAHGDVQPLLLVTDVERREDLAVHVVLVDPTSDVGPGGHRSTLLVFSRRFASPSDREVTDDEVARMRTKTDVAVADRLRRLPAEPEQTPVPELG